MKKCPACAELIQDEARVCRHCGHSFEFKMPHIGCGGAVGIAILIAILIVQCTPDDPNTPSTEQLFAEAEKVTRIERLVKVRLRDPDSAIFQHIGHGCGYVNSKNGFGGMSGNVQFIVGENDNVVFRADNPKDFDTVWTGHCMTSITP